MAPHAIDFSIVFGDFGPVGVVYYSNLYAWLDRTFRSRLRLFGGDAALCREFGAIGIGVIAAHANFRKPMRDGEILRVTLSILDWGRRTLTLGYESRVADDVVILGTEVRGLFKLSHDAIVAGGIEALHARVGRNDEG